MDIRTLAARITDASRLLRRSFDERARDLGVTGPQWRLLSALWQHEGINQGRLADHLEVEPITLCRMIDRLQDAGLVERRRDPADRRAWQLYLSDKAHALGAQLGPLATDVIGAALEGISVEDQANLERTLDRIRLNLSRRNVAVPVSSHG